jgi:hypothetical protein
MGKVTRENGESYPGKWGKLPGKMGKVTRENGESYPKCLFLSFKEMFCNTTRVDLDVFCTVDISIYYIPTHAFCFSLPI